MSWRSFTTCHFKDETLLLSMVIQHKAIVLLSVVFLFHLNATGQKYEWAGKMGGPTVHGYEEAEAVVIDIYGDMYITGRFEGTVDFDPGPGVFNLTASDRDIFVAKLDTNGNLKWAKSMGGSNEVVANNISSDAAGNIYVTGFHWGTIDFDPGPATHNLTALSSFQAFTVKLDSGGVFQWANPITGTSSGRGTVVDSTGNVYGIGSFIGGADFDPGPAFSFLSSSGSQDVYVVKYSQSGSLVWARRMGGTGTDAGWSIDMDNTGDLLLSGAFSNSADFDPGSAIMNLNSVGNLDVFVTKIDTSGSLVWAKGIGGTGADQNFDLKIASSGDILLAGGFEDTVDFDPGPAIFELSAKGNSDGYLLRLDNSGDLIWAKSFESSLTSVSKRITEDIHGNLYSIGYYGSQVDFDPGPKCNWLTSKGDFDVFISKLDSNGNFMSVKSFGGTMREVGLGIAADQAGSVYGVGGFEGTADFDPTTGTDFLTSGANFDIFLLKLSSCNSVVYGVDTLHACDSLTWIDSVSYDFTSSKSTYVLTTSDGCDSIVELHLTVDYSSHYTDVVAACDSFTWINGITYTASNNSATDTLVNAVGCDSIITLDLQIHYTTGTDVINACDSYTWINGVTYTGNNSTAMDTLSNVLGCDSVVTLNLTVNQSTSSIDSVVACDSYTWIDGMIYTSSNNTATDTLINAHGCDSIVFLDLTLNQSSFSTDVIQTCDPYTWINGITYNTSNNTAVDTLMNSSGCDSMVYLDLTIHNIDTSISRNGATLASNQLNASYQWLSCDSTYLTILGETNQTFMPPANGNYAVALSLNGCSDTSSCINISNFDLVENVLFEHVVIYPNPTSGNVNVKVENARQFSLKVSDVRGKVVFKEMDLGVDGTQFEIKEQPGVYIFEISTEKGVWFYKLIKH